MSIDERVLELLSANCLTFGFDESRIICEAMHDFFLREGNSDQAAVMWLELLKILEKENKNGSNTINQA